MADYIPNELVVHILARLPAVSLLRFKTVCKSWQTLISSPSFVTEHLNTRSKANSDKILLGLYTKADRQKHYLLCRDNERFGDEFLEQEFLAITPQRLPPFACFHIGGSANGILCLHADFHRDKSEIILWNPSTRKSVTLPKPEAMSLFLLGLGFHPTTHEYKVVTIEYNTNRTLPASVSPMNVCVYTRGTGRRKLGSTFPPYCFVKYMAPQVFVNGAVNWIGMGTTVSESDGYRNFTVSFDISAETFSVLPLPPTLADQVTHSLSLKDFHGSLAVVCDRKRDNGACMWVMKEYGVPESWTKLFSFKLDGPVILQRALGFRKHGEVLLRTTDGRFLSYNVGTKALTDTAIWENATSVHVVPFVDTLVSVED